MVGEQGSGKSTIALWISNSTEDLQKHRKTKSIKTFQSSQESCLWIPEGKSILVIDTPPLPASFENPDAWAETNWLNVDSDTKSKIQKADIFVLVLDGKNKRHSSQYWSCFKNDFGKMMSDSGEHLKRVMVVVTKVDKKILSEKTVFLQGSGSYTDYAAELKREIGDSQVCEVCLKDIGKLNGSSRMSYVTQKNLANTHNIFELKKIVDFAMKSIGEVQILYPRKLTISTKGGSAEELRTKALFLDSTEVLRQMLDIYYDDHFGDIPQGTKIVQGGPTFKILPNGQLLGSDWKELLNELYHAQNEVNLVLSVECGRCGVVVV